MHHATLLAIYSHNAPSHKTSNNEAKLSSKHWGLTNACVPRTKVNDWDIAAEPVIFKKEQTKPKVSRRKEINEIENKTAGKKINKTRYWFLQK